PGVQPHRVPGDGRRARLPGADESVLSACLVGLAGEERAAAGERGPASLADGATVLPTGPGPEESSFFIPPRPESRRAGDRRHVAPAPGQALRLHEREVRPVVPG